MGMQSHLEENMKSAVYNVFKKTLVPIMTKTFKIDTTEEEILTICSILDTNTFDVRICGGLINVRGAYPTVSLVAHDCMQNTKHVIDDDYQMTLIATVPIKKGEMITTSYTQPLWGTLNRRAHLRQVKHFDCFCKRCSDPSEFGTFAASILCPICQKRNGDSKMISTNCLDRDADWKCKVCDHTMNASEIFLRNESLKREICCIDKNDPKNLEDFLIKHKIVLHSKNCHVLEVKYALIQMYGQMEGYSLTELSNKDLDRKIFLCRELLDVADALQPGLSKFRGTLLYDLQEALVVSAKRNYDNGSSTKNNFQKNLNEALSILKEANKILANEPDRKNILPGKLEDLEKLINMPI